MQALKNSLKYFFAEEILKDIYSSKRRKAFNNNYDKLQAASYGYEYSLEDILRMYARVFKSEMNKKAVKIVLDSLSKEERCLIQLKYGQEKQILAISFNLNMSVGRIFLLHRAILEKIIRFVAYELTIEDIFHKKKIVGMLELLNISIEFFSMLSAEYKGIRKDWLTELKRKKNKYKKILDHIENFEREGKKNSYYATIITKFENPNETKSYIANACHLEMSVARKYLNIFKKSMREYFE